MTIFFPPAPLENWHELCATDVTIEGMTIYSPRGDISERDRLILNLLRPHLIQAYGNVRRYQSLHQNLTQIHRYLDRLGLVILNNLRQIEMMTTPAIAYLESYLVVTRRIDNPRTSLSIDRKLDRPKYSDLKMAVNRKLARLSVSKSAICTTKI